MDNDRNFIVFGSQHHRDSHKSAFGKDHIRFIFFQKLPGFPISFYYPERIGEIFQIEIAAKFTRGNPVIGDLGVFDKLFLDPLIGTDIADLVPKFPQRRNKRQIWCHVAGSSSAG